MTISLGELSHLYCIWLRCETVFSNGECAICTAKQCWHAFDEKICSVERIGFRGALIVSRAS